MEDSSPDLSLKLGRGSSGSRDSYYMDFAQGIDSDIEEISTVVGPKPSIDSSDVNKDGDGREAGDENIETTPTPPAAMVDSNEINNENAEEYSEDSISPPPPPMPLLPSLPTTPPPMSTLLLEPETTQIDIINELADISDRQGSVAQYPSEFHQDEAAELSSKASSPARSLNTVRAASSHHHVTIHEESIRLSASDNTNVGESSLACTPVPHVDSYNNHSTALAVVPRSISAMQSSTQLAVLYNSTQTNQIHSILSPTKRPTRLPQQLRSASSANYYESDSSQKEEVKASEALATTISALYGKLLVIMGIAFPMAEVISTFIPPSFFEVYYLYLYIGSMLFLFFMYISVLCCSPKIPKGLTTPIKTTKIKRPVPVHTTDSGEESDRESASPSPPISYSYARRPSMIAASLRTHHYGSFYLRMGAVAFGIGSMIYSGLEFGQYFELERNTKCHNVLLALTPATRMVFIFVQMYFIFLNNEQIRVYRYKVIARFGLQHMIGTNLSVWFSVLIQETKHEILTFYNPENRTLRISHRLGHKIAMHPLETTAHLRVARGLRGPHNIFECRRTNIIGTLVQDASPFLFPCTIEYSLICAAILYVMWRNVSKPQNEVPLRTETLSACKRSPHHYSVDCARAHKGLFIGILILVLTIISLILFFVLISRPEFVSLAVTEVNICELILYVSTTFASLLGMYQVRNLHYDSQRSFSLDDILLVGGQTGSFLYSTFTVISGHFMLRTETVLVLIAATASLIETACQTMFILNAGRRSAVTPEEQRKKPGREIVTFLLVSNLAMWAINTLEKSRAESHPIQLNFYGLWAWTIITHVSMPLAIFYRFHSTVCLCEIWKRAYKVKPAYM